MSHILLLGAGFVTGPLVEYLHKKGYSMTIASQFIADAESLVAGRDHLTPRQVDVTDDASLRGLIQQADLVISFVPYQFHVAVAKICVEEKKNMVTASYTHEDMHALNQAALDADIIILNEIGVDPGIDHMTAMKTINEAHAKGEAVEALVSWCGGIPAPEANDNPLGYKFSWSPMAVLSAVSNDASYLSRGAEKSIAGDQLMNSMSDVTISEDMELRGYANRDSLSYRQQYGIEEVQTLLRGTLRYPGFGSVIDAARELGLLAGQPFVNKPDNWRALMEQLNAMSPVDVFNNREKAHAAFEWLGCFSEEPVVGDSPIQAFCQLLQSRLAYKEGEQDMIVMQHRFVLTDKAGSKRFLRETLVEKGEQHGFSAMAKTVGYPAAIAADLIMRGQISRKGVCIPVTADIYEPVLAELEKLGIAMTEEVIHGQEEASFLNHL